MSERVRHIVSDFELLHELAARYGDLITEHLPKLGVFMSPNYPPVAAYREGRAIGLLAFIRAEMQAQRDADEAGAAETFKRVEE